MRILKNISDIKSKFSPWLFWDVAEVSVEENRDFIIIRVLNEGTDKDVRSLKEIFTSNEIIHAIQTKRGLSYRTAIYWNNYYQIPSEQCKSLKP